MTASNGKPLDELITLVQDSREQLGYQDLFQSSCVIATLESADYTVLGLENLIGIERKSLSDLLNSLTNNRERFERELRRARSFHKFFILLECSPSDLLVNSFGKFSQAHPRSIWGSLCTWMTRYHPFIFGGNRESSAQLCESVLLGYAKEFFKGTERMTRAVKRITSAAG
jgi:ERCC4-type nuclease